MSTDQNEKKRPEIFSAGRFSPVQEMEVFKVTADKSVRKILLKRKDGKAANAFKAGQYLSLQSRIGTSLVARPYSIYTSPKLAEEGFYGIAVEDFPGAFAGHWFGQLKEGTTVRVAAPLGNFVPDGQKEIIALAGGSGITPFLSMAAAIADGELDLDLTILYGNTSREAEMLQEEIAALQEASERVKVISVYSEEKDKEAESGFPDARLVKKYARGDYEVWACGPGPMYDFLKEDLPQLGLPAARIRMEMSAVTKDPELLPGYPPEAIGERYTVKVLGLQDVYTISALAHEPLSATLERAALPFQTHCRSGVCGWCSALLEEGEVYCPSASEFRSEKERFEGKIRLCTSFPLRVCVVRLDGEE